MNVAGISHKEAASLGWRRVDERPWSKVTARWEGPRGWVLSHCGHPTANWPYLLQSRDGRVHLTGGLYHRDPTLGYAWPNLRDAMLYVAKLLTGELRLRRRGRTRRSVGLR